MITTLVEGVTIHSAAATALVQSAEVENKQEESRVLGMVSGKTQVARVFMHTETNDFSVTGKGDLTLATGLGGTHNLSLITGGVVAIASMKYSQTLGDSSEWTYSGTHYPHAS